MITFHTPAAVLNSAWAQPRPLLPGNHSGQKATPKTTVSGFQPNRTQRAMPTSQPRFTPGYIPPHLRPHLRHLSTGTRPSVKTENDIGTKSVATATADHRHEQSGFVKHSRSVVDQRDVASATHIPGFVSNTSNNFPALQNNETARSARNIMDAPNMELKKEIGAWVVKKDLFLGGPAAVAPSVSGIGSTTLSSPEKLNPFDPSTPGFDAMKFWVQFTRKFKCPYKGCK